MRSARVVSTVISTILGGETAPAVTPAATQKKQSTLQTRNMSTTKFSIHNFAQNPRPSSMLRWKLQQAAKKSPSHLILGGARFTAAIKCLVLSPALATEVAENSLLHLILGGAAVYRCDNCFLLIPALAAEVAALSQKRLFSSNC
jgi:hypothetical protein